MSQASNLRNIAFVGHPSSGKTTLVDALAYAAGVTDRKGSVADRTSLCDTEPEEQEKQHTLQLSVVHADFEGCRFNWIDTPGYPEFDAEVREAIFAADLVVGVVSATSGVTHNLRRKLAEALELGRPRALLVTHPEAERFDFEECVEELREAFGEVCVPVLLPDGAGPAYAGVHRVMKDEASPWRKRLMDRTMDGCDDDAAVAHYLETETLTEEEIKTHVPHAIGAGTLVPILVCNPSSGVGVKEVLDFLRRCAPSPDENQSIVAGGEVVAPDPAGPLLGVVFGVRSDPHLGQVCYARVQRGTLGAHDPVVGAGDDAPTEKLGGLFLLQGGKQRKPVERVEAGDLCAFSKVEELGVGDSFGAPGKPVPQIAFPRMPEPMVSLAVRPKSRGDEQKIGPALQKVASEDPTLLLRHDPHTHELVVTGMSDLHLQVMQARLARRFHVEIETSLPRIAYRETVRKAAEGHHRHKKQSGGRGQFGECHLRIRPGAEDSGLVFLDKVVGGSIPRNLIPAVEKGVRELASHGILTQSRVVDVEVEVYEGKFHAVDSDEASFKIAGARAFRDAFEKASPALLEPVMEVRIAVPTEHSGAIFSDLTSHRRGHVHDQETEADGAVTVITAHVPLVALQTYHRDLKSQTGGAGTWSMRLVHYAPAPPAEQQRVLAEFGKRHDDD
ncbi:MAG TPA: elongation factor G [Planctomycetota bacterium]|nr:elongation factor G [Planctomycetota bacterium]